MKPIVLALLFLCGSIGAANAKILHVGGTLIISAPVVASIALTGSNCTSSQCGFTPAASVPIGTASVTMSSGSFGAGTYALATSGTDHSGSPCGSITGTAINSSTGAVTGSAATPGGVLTNFCVAATPAGGSAFTQAFTIYPGLFVSTSGSGSTCTYAAPCASPATCQSAMNSTNYTCFVRSGTYTLSTPFNFGSNQYLSVYPPDGIGSAKFNTSGAGNIAFHFSGVNNAALYGITVLDMPSTYDVVRTENSSSNIYVDRNTFQGTLSTTSGQDFYLYNSDNVYVRGNSFSGGTIGSVNNTSEWVTDGNAHSGWYITNNQFTGCTNACMEGAVSPGSLSNSHADWNTFTNFQGNNNTCAQVAFAAISWVMGTSTTSSTIWGNTFTVPSNSNTCIWSIEVQGGYSIEHNTNNYVGVFVNMDYGNGTTEIENNTINRPASGGNTSESGCNSQGCAFGQDGGYNATEWIGTNTIDGSSVGACTANFCYPYPGSPAWPSSYGTQPTVATPAPQYNNTFP